MRPKNDKLPNKIKIWEFILNFYKEKLLTPTFQEIASFMGFVHRQQVSTYIDMLRTEGKISTVPKVKRSIKIL